jgi:hypothetical protein
MYSNQPNTAPNLLRRWIANSFGIDPRSLAVFRVAVGALLLVDLAIRATDFSAMYVDGGIMPIDTVREYFGGRWCWSVHWLSGAAWYQTLLFSLAGVFAAMLLVGFQTRIATIASWVLLMSLHRHAPLVINAGDTLLRELLFWSMFLPLGRIWSVDSKRTESADRLGTIVSMAGMGILLQVCLMYWFTAIFKFMGGWNGGDGLESALRWGGYNRPFADVLLEHPTLMWALSLATVWLELLAPIVILVPMRSPKLRLLVVGSFWLLHLGIEMTMHIGLFSFISIIAWLLFLPREFWQWFIRDRSATATSHATTGALLAVNLTCGALLGVVVALNVFSVLNRFQTTTPTPLRRFHQAAMMHQQWSMFAERVPATSWLIADATLEDGSRVDLLREGQPVDKSRPKRIAELHKNHRWRKYAANLSMLDSERFDPFFQPLAEWLFRQWNRQHGKDQQIAVLRLERLRDMNSPDGREYHERRVATITAPDAGLFGVDPDWELDH